MEQKERYPNLAALNSAHRQLLEQRRQSGESPAFYDQVELFIRRGQAAGVLLGKEEDRWNAQNLLDYWANELLHANREAFDATLQEFDPAQAPILPNELCPYVGLDPFSSEQHDFFYGRDQLIATMLDRLQQNRGLILVGPSGSGKSSAILAGLIPKLQAGAIQLENEPDSAAWHYYPPLLPGAGPLISMARLLQPQADDTEIQAVKAQILQAPDFLASQISQHDNRPAVILIDQFEELFTLCYQDQARYAFINNCLHLLQVPAPRHIVIFTVRSDFETILVQIPELYALFEQTQVRVTAMKASELREAITKPAEKVGLQFEDGLVDELIREVLGETAALPLLQFTLLKLWENRVRNRITGEAYERLGGGRQALANAADDLYESLSPAEQITARRIFSQIVHPDDSLKITRARILRRDLYQEQSPARIDRVLEKFVQARLLRLTKDERPEEARVEIAHETLAQTWPRLAGWLEEDRVTRRRRLRLSAMAEEWQTRNQDPSTLLRGLLLEEAATYTDLNKIEEAFVEASQQEAHREQLAHEAEQQEKLRQAQALANEQSRRAKESSRAAIRARRLAMLLTAVFFIAVIAAITAAINREQAESSAATAVANQAIAEELRLTSDASAVTAVASEATAEASANLRATAEADANLQRDTAEDAAAAAEDAQATAEFNAQQADIQFHLATSRELAAAANDQLQSDPQLALLLALEAVNFTYQHTQTAPAEAEDALYRALQASQLQLTLSGHTDGVHDVAFNADGSLLATAGLDAAVKIWDAHSGQTVQTFTDSERGFNSVAFSPAQPHLAAAGLDGSVYIWDLTSGRRVRRLASDGGSVQAIAYNADGSLLAAAMADASVRVWDMTSGESLLRLVDGHKQAVNDVSFSQDGSQVVSAGEDGLVVFWDLATGTAVANLPIAGSPENPIAINSLAFSPDGSRLLIGQDDNTARIWDTASKQPIVTLSGHTSAVIGVAYSPNGRYLATASQDGTAKVWDTTTNQVAYTLSGHNGPVSAVIFSADNRRLATASQDNTAKAWNAQPALDISNLSDHSAPVTSVAFSPDNTLVATASEDKTIKIWATETGLFQITLTGPNNSVNDVAFSSDGRFLAAASTDRNAWVWDTETYELVHVFQRHGGAVTAVQFNKDNTLLATASEDGVARLWSLENGRVTLEFNHGAPILDLAFSPDGRQLATTASDGTVMVWDSSSGAIIQSLIGHAGAVNSAAFSPIEPQLATAGSDGMIKLWDLKNGSVILSLSGHTGSVLSVNYSPDGRYLATASVDKTAKLWNPQTGQVLRTFLGHTSTVHSVTFSSDGRYLATASSDRTAQLITLKTLGQLLERGQAIATRRLSQEECAQYLRGEPCLMIDKP
ncbi:MAG: hypothetical protein H6667_02260 [Ardenticatenaceae bacterium]|nr:hypothetical protein [Ardenticatenaceae bacterium]MCB9443333.1 hypothetical protein [Ardenticatenaceae bacterium]